MIKDLRRSKIFQKTGCTRLCFFLGGIGASLTIGATSLTYLFLHEQLEFSASMIAKEQVSAACGAINSLAFSLLEASLTSEETTRDLPAWKLATGHDTAYGIHWVSAPAEQLARKVARIVQQQVVHAGDVPNLQPPRLSAPNSHTQLVIWCRKTPVRCRNSEERRGEGVPVAFKSIPEKTQRFCWQG